MRNAVLAPFALILLILSSWPVTGCAGRGTQTAKAMPSQEDHDSASPPQGDAPPAAGGLAYPVARKGDVADVYHGTRVADPYRWLEDPDSDETRAWIEAENKVTFPFLEAIPQRRALGDRLTALWNYEKWSVPSKRG